MSYHFVSLSVIFYPSYHEVSYYSISWKFISHHFMSSGAFLRNFIQQLLVNIKDRKVTPSNLQGRFFSWNHYLPPGPIKVVWLTAIELRLPGACTQKAFRRALGNNMWILLGTDTKLYHFVKNKQRVSFWIHITSRAKN